MGRATARQCNVVLNKNTKITNKVFGQDNNFAQLRHEKWIAIFQACPICLCLSRYFSTRPSHMYKCTLHRKPCRVGALVIFLRAFGWFVMCEPFWSVHRPHRVLGFAVRPSCWGHGLALLPDGYHSKFRLVFQGEYVAHLCARFGLANPRSHSFAGLGLIVTFACRSGLNNRVASPGFTRRAVPHPKFHPANTNINIEARAQKHKYNKKYREA